jgi:hypothetical protein
MLSAASSAMTASRASPACCVSSCTFRPHAQVKDAGFTSPSATFHAMSMSASCSASRSISQRSSSGGSVGGAASSAMSGIAAP